MTEKEWIHKSALLCAEYVATEGCIEYMQQQIPKEERRKNRTQREIDAYNQCMAIYKECLGKVDALREKVYDKSVCIIPEEYFMAAQKLDWLVQNDCAATLREAIEIYEKEFKEQKKSRRDKKAQNCG